MQVHKTETHFLRHFTILVALYDVTQQNNTV